MYTRSNTHPDAPGHWTTADGEYEFFKTGKTWNARRRDSGRTIASTRTLNAALDLAARHYVHPVVPVDRWVYPNAATYRCSGDIPAGHVPCDFETDSLDAATRHFERTAHNVDGPEAAEDAAAIQDERATEREWHLWGPYGFAARTAARS